jgi:uncharacterized membrane protein YeaQ/YmgE (transglycosylase-associated protein family)
MIMAARVAYTQPQAGSQGFARTKKVFGSTITFVLADIALNAQTAVARVPKGFVLQSISGTWGAVSAATLSMSLGDNGSASAGIAANLARFTATATTPIAGGAVGSLAAAGLLYEFPEDTDILATATIAGTTLGATPTLALLMEGYIK